MTQDDPVAVSQDRICDHGVRWPHACHDCEERDIPRGKSITEHPCHGRFASQKPGELSHRACVSTTGPMYCERCGTELDVNVKHKSGAPLSWEPRQSERNTIAGAGEAWIVGDSSGVRWRTWNALGPTWTEDREKATRYARREDAEQVHEADEEAWRVQRYIGATPADTKEEARTDG